MAIRAEARVLKRLGLGYRLVMLPDNIYRFSGRKSDAKVHTVVLGWNQDIMTEVELARGKSGPGKLTCQSLK